MGLVGVNVLVPESNVEGTNTPSMYSFGTSPAAGAATVNVGVVSLVVSSMLLVPLSVPAAMSGAIGADGTAVSMVKFNSADCAPVLPAAST